jgi:hypothetical protein
MTSDNKMETSNRELTDAERKEYNQKILEDDASGKIL